MFLFLRATSLLKVREVIDPSVRSLFHTFLDIGEKGDQIIDLTGLRIQIVINTGAFFPAFYDAASFSICI